MIVGQVTARYATALFELARSKGLLEAVERDVEFLGAELSVPAVSRHLFDARVAPADKRKTIERLGPHVNPLTFNFLRLLHAKRRLEVLRELQGAFQRCVLNERGSVEGVVETPRPLPAGDLAELEVALGARLGKQVKLANRLAPELIAGARVIVDNKLLDQSATGRLEGLRQRMLRAR